MRQVSVLAKASLGMADAGADDVEATHYFPGMVNLSGVLCYMNSVLQVCLAIG